MTTVAVIAVRNRFAIGITGPMDVLQKASRLAGDAQPSDRPPRALEVHLLAADRAPVTYPNGVTIVPSATIDEALRPDVIVVPQLDDDDLGRSLDENRAYVPWLRAGYAQGACLASFCTGAFLVAETGLLAHQRATTHWQFAEEFRRRYPLVRLESDRLIVDAGNIITSGAATSFLDLAIYLLDRYCGHETAVRAAKMFLVDTGRTSQLPYTVLNIQPQHRDEPIARAQQLILEGYAGKLGVEDLAHRAGLSVRQFGRRFHQATGDTPSTYIQRVRIEAAKRLLEGTPRPVAEVMTLVGYEDERAFRRLFRRHAGLSPTAYRRRYASRTPGGRA